MFKKPLLPRWLRTTLLIGLGGAALVGSVAIDDPDVVVRLTLAVVGIALFMRGADGEGDTLGSPRYRRLRAFNPSKRYLKRVRAKSVTPPPSPEGDNWPKPVLRDTPPGQVAELDADPWQFNLDVKQLHVHIETDANPAPRACDFTISTPGQQGWIDEFEVTVEDGAEEGTLKAIACVYYYEEPGGPLQRSQDVEHIF